MRRRIDAVAVALLLGCAAAQAQTASDLYVSGVEAFEQARWDEAAASFEAALRLLPDAPRVQHMLARTLIEKKAPPEPERLAAALEAVPSEMRGAVAHYWVGRARLLQQDTDTARTAFEAALAAKADALVTRERIRDALDGIETSGSTMEPDPAAVDKPKTPRESNDPPRETDEDPGTVTTVVYSLLLLVVALAATLVFMVVFKWKVVPNASPVLLLVTLVLVFTFSGLVLDRLGEETFKDIAGSIVDLASDGDSD